jgi:hypothetical protein
MGSGLTPFRDSTTHQSSDAAMERVFEQHEEDFGRLIDMSRVDSKVIRIAPDFTWLDDNARWPRPESQLGFTKERWDEYKRLFSELSLREGLARDTEGDTVYLIAYSEGLGGGGSGKGYVYSSKELSPLYDSLDNLPPASSNGKHVYKKLKGSWYLFYYNN